MPSGDKVFLRKHHLPHIPVLAVDTKLLRAKFSRTCAVSNCRGDCCRYGVWVDVKERDLILAYASVIRNHMEPHQEKNPESWFERNETEETDYPSGRAVGTQERETGCVFLDSGGQCVLQKAATAEGLDRFYLKPFFCVAYPITIENHILTLDDEEFPNNPHCCSALPGGIVPVIEVCEEELIFTLGRAGFDEFCEHVRREQ